VSFLPTCLRGQTFGYKKENKQAKENKNNRKLAVIFI
jgi:hypothetical protein